MEGRKHYLCVTPTRLVVVLVGVTLACNAAMAANERGPGHSSKGGTDISWRATLDSLQVDNQDFVGQRFSFRCPAQHFANVTVVLSGTVDYTSDSMLCAAALHAGIVDPTGGSFTLQLNPGINKYLGSAHNGMVSGDFPATRRSFKFVTRQPAPRLDALHLAYAPRLRWDTRFTRTGLANRQLVGQRYLLHCPPAPDERPVGAVRGTDRYAFNSLVCLAAVHAGRLTYQGGYVGVRVLASQTAVRGSIRHGIESRGTGTGLRVIAFLPPVSNAETER